MVNLTYPCKRCNHPIDYFIQEYSKKLNDTEDYDIFNDGECPACGLENSIKINYEVMEG